MRRAMPILTCPTCSKQLNIPDNYMGKKVKCSACLAVITAEAPAEKPKRRDDSDRRPARTDRDPDSRVADEDDRDDSDDRPSRDRDRSRRRRSRSRGGYLKPHRGTLIL